MKKRSDGGTTQNALLGLLTMGPRSGYDIRGLIDDSIGHFWRESYGQIYPSLKRLAAEGLVGKKTERKKGRPDRNVFSLTPAGRQRLKEWLKLPLREAETPRNELLLKLFFGQHVPAEANRQHVKAFVEIHESALKHYAATEKQLHREEVNDPQLPYWLMTLSFGRHRSEAFVAWGRETLKRLDELERANASAKTKYRDSSLRSE
jgi:DNA-binding PadR family transcriptional regulator